jgi:hypothetical protein
MLGYLGAIKVAPRSPKVSPLGHLRFLLLSQKFMQVGFEFEKSPLRIILELIFHSTFRTFGPKGPEFGASSIPGAFVYLSGCFCTQVAVRMRFRSEILKHDWNLGVYWGIGFQLREAGAFTPSESRPFTCVPPIGAKK